MMTVNQIRRALADRRLSVVSKATGIHYNTLRDIRDGITSDPRHGTVLVISKYLEVGIETDKQG